METLPLHTLYREKKLTSLRFETILPVAVPPAAASHRHDYFEIFLFAEGGGTHMVDFTEYDICSRSLHLVCPGQVHLLRRKPDSLGWVIMLSRDFLLSVLDFQPAHPQLPFLHQAPAAATLQLPEADYTLLHLLYQQLAAVQDSDSSKWEKPELVRAVLKLVVLKCAELLQPAAEPEAPAADSQGQRLARQFSQLVEAHFQRQHQVAYYAGELAVTAGHLNVLSKSRLGKMASEVIQERILLEAKRLLLHTEAAAKEIAYSLGFEDPSHFAKFFKARCSVSPSEFRQQIRDIYQQ